MHGDLKYTQIRAAHRQGTGGKFQMFGGGTPNAGDPVIYDASGNVVPTSALGYAKILSADRKGDGSQFCMFGGGGAGVGNAAVFDAAGNLVDFGAAPGGGGAGVASFGTRASLPASPEAGDIYYCTDAPLVYIAGGSPISWSCWACGYNVAEPDLNDFAWVNQTSGGQSGSTDTTLGGVYLLAPAVVSDNMRILIQTAPSTPYTITAAFITRQGNANYPSCGLVFRQSSDGKLHNWHATWNNGWKFGSIKMNSPTSFSANYYLDNMPLSYNAPLIWFRIADDGASRICSHSPDGQRWQTFHTVGRTDFLTANQVGFFANCVHASYPCGIWLLHWAVA